MKDERVWWETGTAIDKVIGGVQRQLTPRHLFRQFDPSLFVNGQTTSLLASDTEKELVSEVRGGMVCISAVTTRIYSNPD